MRVTLICQYYPPEQSAVQYGYNLAKGLAAGGHDVTVIAGLPHHPTGRPHPEFGRFRPRIRTEENSVRVIRTPLVMGSNRQSIRRLLGFLTFSISAFLWTLCGKRPGIVVASVPPATSALSGLMAAWICRCPFVVILRDIEPWRRLSMSGGDRRALGRALIAIFMWIYRHAQRVVVMHEREIPHLTERGVKKTRIHVIPHGVASRQLEHVRSTTPAFPRRPGRRVLLYTGTIGLVHGLPDFLHAMTNPRIRALPVDVVIIGDGQYKAECAQIIRTHQLDNVTILPVIPGDKVPAAQTQADLLLCAFRNGDGIPLCSKFYEYCAAGKPILVYGDNIAGDLVAKIGNGRGCHAGDTESLLAILTDFVADPQTWQCRGLKGLTYAQENFAQELRDRQWEALLASVTHPAGGA